jgi:fatty acid-binding protein DegV
MAIMYNTDLKEADELADRIAALYPREKIIMGKVGPILSTHAGPNLLVTCFRGNKQPKN